MLGCSCYCSPLSALVLWQLLLSRLISWSTEPVYVCVTRCYVFAPVLQLFPLNVDPRWPSSPPRQLTLALQQALAQELARARQGHAQPGGVASRLLQALAALLNSAHGGALVMAMHRSHAHSCPLLRQLHQYQVRGPTIPQASARSATAPLCSSTQQQCVCECLLPSLTSPSEATFSPTQISTST